MIKQNKIILALDTNDISKALSIVKSIDANVIFKLGMEFFYTFGYEGIEKVKSIRPNIKIFLDLKLHDIPNTIKKAMEAIANLKPYFTTIHISGGDEMQRMSNLVKDSVKILGVSILTSINEEQAEKYYYLKDIKMIVSKFVKTAMENKLDGVVCSPHEIKQIKEISNDKLLIITPGIRPESYNQKDDQKRFMTPKQAIELGANFLVIGRPITKSSNPLNEIKSINYSIE